MKQANQNPILLTIDWLVYLSLYILGIYFIQQDNVLQKFSLKRTNFARYQEPISERPTIMVYLEPLSLPLKYGKDFIISYRQDLMSDDYDYVYMTFGENKIGKDVIIEFEEILSGHIFKVTPILSHDILENYDQVIDLVFNPEKLDIMGYVTIGMRLSTENNSVSTWSWSPSEMLDGKQLFYKIDLGYKVIALLPIFDL